jgi:glycosyltransferase involved in cell wall biosynthesis
MSQQRAAGPHRSVRVLEIQGGVGLGGSERHTLQLAVGLNAREDLDVSVVGAYANEPEMHRELRAAGVPVHDLDLVTPTRAPATLVRLVRLVRDDEIDLIHTHLRNADLLGIMTGMLTRTPVVVTLHGATGPAWPLPVPLRSRIIKGLHGVALRHGARRVIAVSHFAKQHSLRDLRLSPTQVSVIHNASDATGHLRSCGAGAANVRSSLGLDPEARIVSFIGRLDRQKGLHHFLRMARIVAAEVPESRFLVVGEGPPGPAPGPLLDAPSLRGRVVFTGGRRDVATLLELTDVLVVTARGEGFGRVITEAMAAAKPVVAFASGAVPELVVDGETGYLVEPGDVTTLSRRVASLLRDPDLRRDLGHRGKSRCEARFSVPRFVEETASTLLAAAGGDVEAGRRRTDRARRRAAR